MTSQEIRAAAVAAAAAAFADRFNHPRRLVEAAQDIEVYIRGPEVGQKTGEVAAGGEQ